MLLNKRIPISYLLGPIKLELIYTFLIAILVYVFTGQFHDILPEMPLTIPAFIGTSISIILSFKLNQSYDRWWEARKVWGGIVNDSRSLVLQLQGFLSNTETETIKAFAYRQIAWCYSLGQSLRGLNPLDNITDLIASNELAKIATQSNKPLGLLQLHIAHLSRFKNEGKLDSVYHAQIDSTLVRLCDHMGKAERINGTVFPVTYRLILHLLIYLFIITLSIALREVESYFEIPLLMVIASAFFLLERKATLIQDPFKNRPSDTSVTAIARTIEINLKQLINDDDVPQPLPTNKFYIL